MKILRTVGILALVAGLVLGGAGSAFAQGPPEDPPGGGPHSPGKRGLFGTVTSTAGYDVTLVTKEGSTVEVTLTETANYVVPKETKGPVDRDDFEMILDGNVDEDITAIEGRRIAVLVKDIAEGGNPPDFTATAIRLMLIPSPSSPPTHAHRVGIVDAFTAGTSITIIDKDGDPHTFDLNGTVYRPDEIAELTGTELEEALADGFVTVVTKGDPKLPNPVAKAIVLHDELPEWAP